MTNKSTYKIVGWDADYYNGLSDDECLICLTEKQVYLIGVVIGAIQWSTRWIGNITGFDLKAIQDNLEYRIAERMTCQNVSTLLQKIIDLEIAIDNISDEVVPPEEIDDPVTQSFTETFTEAEIEAFSASVDVCDDDGKDAIYGGVVAIVNYIHAVNLDSLQELSQIGNVPDQIARFISATPVGLLPFDEAFDFAEFIATELLEEYEAVVNEELLENVRCDLFCIAVANDCTLSWNDIINYFGSKVAGDGSLSSTLGTITNVAQFALTGTFSGNDYFYFLCLFQLISVAVANKYFDTRGIEYYATILKTGLNSPDNDWTLLCDACPPLFRHLKHDFQYGLGDWEIEVISGTPRGTLTNGHIESVAMFGEQQYAIKRLTDPTWRFIGANIIYLREGGGNTVMRYRPTPDSNTGAGNPSIHGYLGTIPAGYSGACQNDLDMGSGFGLNYADTVQQVYIFQNDTLGNDLRLKSVDLLFKVDYAPIEAVITENSDGCFDS